MDAIQIDYSTPFVVPDRTTPRERWTATAQRTNDGGWPRCEVTVNGPDGQRWAYQRNYGFLRTFEPFRQLHRDGTWREYALISPSYTTTSVMDLTTGEIVATEQLESPAWGFCPVEFYVPDWWEPDAWGDQDGSVTPDSDHWEDHDGARRGQLGFVAGCVWGDDSSWKVQVLDLRRIDEGVVGRSDPFGYIELPSGIRLRDAIDVDWESNRITFAVPASFSMRTGVLADWSLDGLNRKAEQ